MFNIGDLVRASDNLSNYDSKTEFGIIVDIREDEEYPGTCIHILWGGRNEVRSYPKFSLKKLQKL